MSSNAPKEKGIVFSGPMVRAILDGKKSMTRRVMKRQPEGWMASHLDNGFRKMTDFGNGWWGAATGSGNVRVAHTNHSIKCPFNKVGDRLWVRETWAKAGEIGDAIEYRADNPDPLTGKWRSPIHMPRWASRITLEITGVKVERLQDISDADCFAEGVIADRGNGETWYDGKAKEIFSRAWDAMHGHDSWAANPWVWVISFRRIDAARVAA